MTFFGVETSGDCSLAVKGAAPRPMFELRIELDWKATQKVDNGKSLFETKGQIVVSNFSSEDIPNPQMSLTCDSKLPPGATPAFTTLMKKMQEAVRLDGMPKVASMLSQNFVQSLTAQ
eukprot:CAMPEP_0194497650 /NCGR_PEP_ID=MMETSP0253-20130528/14526_1 /TAXON_ID=2966 /ORGANISM="Noctiluca scintillans" /LENGTH=117 /DNA_ID=CAMNT_0039339171 /DNA_START=128 /DNA_END=481 /DNA_ORIENTATION=+